MNPSLNKKIAIGIGILVAIVSLCNLYMYATNYGIKKPSVYTEEAPVHHTNPCDGTKEAIAFYLVLNISYLAIVLTKYFRLSMKYRSYHSSWNKKVEAWEIFDPMYYDWFICVIVMFFTYIIDGLSLVLLLIYLVSTIL